MSGMQSGDHPRVMFSPRGRSCLSGSYTFSIARAVFRGLVTE